MIVALIDELMRRSRKQNKADKEVFEYCEAEFGLTELPRKPDRLSSEVDAAQRYEFVLDWINDKQQAFTSTR